MDKLVSNPIGTKFKQIKSYSSLNNCLVSNPIGTKFKLWLLLIVIGLQSVSNPIGTKFKFINHQFEHIGRKFQIPQGQSSNSTGKARDVVIDRFQIPQGQSSNLLLGKQMNSLICFKSHRDKVQIRAEHQGTIFRGSFKSHRDKVQIQILFSCQSVRCVSNPIGTKFKQSPMIRDCSLGVFQIPQGQSSNVVDIEKRPMQ